MPSEVELIAATRTPATPVTLARDLRALGVTDGDVVMVHTSMSKLGWIAGHAQSVVEALLTAVGAGGTIAMPTHSGQLTDPGRWENPPVPQEWVEQLRGEMPAFDPAVTPTRRMGVVAECFRKWPGTQRSPHPTLSIAAHGPAAEAIVAAHPLTPSMGEESPLARLYDLEAKVLLLGVDHGNNTSLHLAEYRTSWPGQHRVDAGTRMLVDGRPDWVTFDDLFTDSDDFAALGDAFAATGAEQTGPVGTGEGRLCRQRAIVDFAVEWLAANRT